jgi:hypothetical protein
VLFKVGIFALIGYWITDPVIGHCSRPISSTVQVSSVPLASCYIGSLAVH